MYNLEKMWVKIISATLRLGQIQTKGTEWRRRGILQELLQRKVDEVSGFPPSLRGGW
jgi:hypothetical protein